MLFAKVATMGDSPHINRVAADVNRPPSTTRKVMPKPFARPGINLTGGPAAKRDWKYIPAHQVSAGDTVPGVGLVAKTAEHHRADEVSKFEWTVTLTGIDGTSHAFFAGHEVYAFIEVNPGTRDAEEKE